MHADPWLPIGTSAGSAVVGRLLQDGPGWQIYADSRLDGRVLILDQQFASWLFDSGLLSEEGSPAVAVGGRVYHALPSGPDHQVSVVDLCNSPRNLSDALSFAAALRRSRESLPHSSLAHGIFVERASVILPIPGAEPLDDGVLLGRYLTGGVPIPVDDRRRLAAVITWLPRERIDQVCQEAGFALATPAVGEEAIAGAPSPKFRLPGRPILERFFLEHVIDIVENSDRYAALGIQFPGAVVLYGPPGSGKTFAVDRLIDYLNWPRFEISSGSIGSPYIHETGRKVAEVFSAAAGRAPSVLVIDEMEAFLTDRGSADSSSTHHVEEVAEFLRRIPEAVQHHVLVIAMTNRIDTIDPAILRRGRFDHIIEVGLATEEEVRVLLDDLLSALPHEGDLDTAALARAMSGRPLADVAFVLREAARLTARDGRSLIDQATLLEALKQAPPRSVGESERPRIGF